MTQITPSLPTY